MDYKEIASTTQQIHGTQQRDKKNKATLIHTQLVDKDLRLAQVRARSTIILHEACCLPASQRPLCHPTTPRSYASRLLPSNSTSEFISIKPRGPATTAKGLRVGGAHQPEFHRTHRSPFELAASFVEHLGLHLPPSNALQRKEASKASKEESQKQWRSCQRTQLFFCRLFFFVSRERATRRGTQRELKKNVFGEHALLRLLQIIIFFQCHLAILAWIGAIYVIALLYTGTPIPLENLGKLCCLCMVLV